MIRRLLTVVGFVLGLFMMGTLEARANVVFTDGAQKEFGIDADGMPTGSGSGVVATGWEYFWGAPEGQRIFTYLEQSDVEVIVDVLPPDQVGSGESAGRVYGTEKVEERDPSGKPTKIRIKIRSERTGGAENLADTIWHEFRHAEIDFQGEHHEHDELDGEDSEPNERFRMDVERVKERIEAQQVDPDPPTPLYDSLRDRATGEELRTSAWLLGDILEDIRDSISFNQPALRATYIDLETYGAAKYGYDLSDVTVTFNESIVECGDESDYHIVVCSEAGVLDMPAGDVGLFVMELAGDIPLAGGEHSLIYSVVLDSDRDPANDWVFMPPFDWDFFQGTDRWYQLIYDHISDEWSLTVTQLTANGEIPEVVEASTVRAVVEGDVVAVFISMEEFAADDPAFRFSAFGHDGFFTESTRGGDVSGSDPTEPPIPIGAEVFEASPQE